MSPIVLDVVAGLLLVASAVVFYFGADALTTHKDVNAIYWVIVGVALVRAGSHLGRRDRTAS